MGDRVMKNIVITGVTAGLGLALTEYFQGLSHCVIGCGRNAAKIDSLNRKTASAEKKNQKNFSVVDISNDTEVAEWAGGVVKEFGPIDILINNAGIINNNAKLWEVPAEEFNKVVDINIKGTVNCIRHFVPHMINAKKGVIVNFTSTWGKTVSADVAPYCCTKWGLEGLSKALAVELPPPLACVPLNPGVIDTDMLQTTFGSFADSFPTPAEWVETAGPLILGLNRNANGRSLNAQL